jgi:hypothetical protein
MRRSTLDHGDSGQATLPRPPPSSARPSQPAASTTYRPRRPTATPLYPVVQHHLETFLTRAAEADLLANGVP